MEISLQLQPTEQPNEITPKLNDVCIILDLFSYVVQKQPLNT